MEVKMKRMIVAETEIGKICNLKWTERVVSKRMQK